MSSVLYAGPFEVQAHWDSDLREYECRFQTARSGRIAWISIEWFDVEVTLFIPDPVVDICDAIAAMGRLGAPSRPTTMPPSPAPVTLPTDENDDAAVRFSLLELS